jgi:3-demethoxyubiquinol 3-hydroxylase
MNSMDVCIANFDKMLRVMAGVACPARLNPALTAEEVQLAPSERRHSAGLMRVNHVGEVCAQGLYEAQAQFTQNARMRQQFVAAAREEEDHLAWTAERLRELGGHTSILNPLWYVGAYALGVAMAKLGDARSLGFVVETERQVEAHLASHLEDLPARDQKSRAIVEQMRIDEAIHGAAAKSLGAIEPSTAMRTAMRTMAKIMTSAAYYV